jgi:hypothetical protein
MHRQTGAGAFHLSGPGRTKRSFWAGSIALTVAIGLIGATVGRQASAQLLDPQGLIELLKKKKANQAVEEGQKKGLPKVFQGKKQDGTKTAVTPKNVPGNTPGGAPGSTPGNVRANTPGAPGQPAQPGQPGQPGQNSITGKGFAPKGGPDATRGPTSASLPNNAVDTKGGVPKAGLGKNAVTGNTPGGNAKGPIGNAADGKGTALSKATDGKAGGPKGLLGKGTDSKGATAALSKGIDPKGLPNAKSVIGKAGDIKGAPNIVRTAVRGPLRGANPIERLRFRADHRREIFAVRRLLPVRPLPGQPGFTGVPPVGETRFVQTEMVFRIGPNVSRQSLDDTARRLGLTVIGSQNIGIAGGTLYHFRVAQGRPVADVVRSLEAENIGVASPNYVYRLFQETPAEEPELSSESNKGASEQYVVNKLQLDEVHKVATGSNVLVAVIDSAIDGNHPDLSGAIVEQYDAVGKREKPHYHGTGMVGAIAAHQKLLGIAPNARILAVHAFSSTTRQSPEATTRQILAGIEWAISKGARVINMSFAGPHDPLLQVAMKNAATKGVILIAASGNLGPKSPPLYPAADPNVIAVSATDENDKPFAQAVRGPHVAVSAPGVDVMVPAPDDTYQLTTGTSVAAAHVSGVAALLLERHPTANAATILEVLTSTARKIGTKDRDDQFGWGLIDPAAALAELDSRMADSKVASVTAPKQTAQKAAAPKQQAAPKTAAPKLAPASAQ